MKFKFFFILIAPTLILFYSHSIFSQVDSSDLYRTLEGVLVEKKFESELEKLKILLDKEIPNKRWFSDVKKQVKMLATSLSIGAISATILSYIIVKKMNNPSAADTSLFFNWFFGVGTILNSAAVYVLLDYLFKEKDPQVIKKELIGKFLENINLKL